MVVWLAQVPYKYPGMESPVWVDVYNRMYRERIMFMGQPIMEDPVNQIIAVMLFLDSEEVKPMYMYTYLSTTPTYAPLSSTI